jgi:hypothetical protein
MRTIKKINEKVYALDTEKGSIELAEYWNGTYDEYRKYTETLYKLKNHDVFFLCVYGGPLTCMARSCGSNNTTGSSEIRLFDDEKKVKEWLLKRELAEAYSAIFPNEIIE